jgi:peptidylprolyl isomerase
VYIYNMNKYIIVLLVLIIGIFSINFLFKGDKSLNKDIIDVSTSSTPSDIVVKDEVKNINNLDNKDTKKMTTATLNTNKGNIVIEFYDQQTPKTVANFLKLAKEGFYDGVKFHRVIKGFMIQGGDPLTKDDSKMSLWGTGGPGYKFADEIGAKNSNDVGTISMANSGPNTNGSQFFINVANNSFLNTKHTVFGKVVSGMDVVTQIENTPTGAGDRPVSPVIIKSISVQ